MKDKQRSLMAAGMAFCVAILAILTAFASSVEVYTALSATAEETPVVTLTANILLDTEPPVIAVEATPEPEPEPVPRYAAINMSEDEREELARIVYLEAGNQCAEGQQAVVEVVLNRVIAPEFPNTVYDVLHQGEGTKRPQFSTIGNLALAKPMAAQYEAIDAALYGPSILPDDVVFFSRKGENDRVWGKIQDHVFCYKYIWE